MEDWLLQPPRGMNDWTPDKYYSLMTIVSRFSKVAESFGYSAIETPALEHFEVLKAKAGEEVINEIYYLKDKAGRELGLRFDMTVPVARVLSYRRDFPRPIRLYYVSKVWRYDEPQFGRFREFYQFGVEHVGSPTVQSDAEVLALAVKALDAVNLPQLTVRVSDRRVMDQVLERLGINTARETVLRVLDKRGKVPDDELVKLLVKEGIGGEEARYLVDVANVKVPISEAAGELRRLSISDALISYVESLSSMLSHYNAVDRVYLDLSIVRGLDYYTGFVFELYTDRIKLAVGGGGRYDELLKIYSGEDVPAVGFAIGIERVMLALGEEINQQPPIDYYIYPMDPKYYELGVRIADHLRNIGFRVILDVGKPSLRSALEYASRIKSRKFIIIGRREAEGGFVRVRDLETWMEEDVAVDKILK
ncbi:histidine--tRNA ligase [Caldivirga sp.]|uniref:histidine--tRNA ligase n=1 Tax=Caldivirga sp. TaxID=2080243 RepID=UPI003D11BCE6